MTRIGLVGLGRMGTAMAGRLLETGADLTVWNRTPERVAPVVALGARAAASLGDLAAGTDIVLSILADDAAALAVYRGPGGLFDVADPDCLLVEMSTLRPRTILQLGEVAAARSLDFLECPVMGTVGPARAGQLLGLVGGEAELADRAAPVLDRMCRRQIRTGPLGTAARLKLSINDLLISYLGILAEALSFGVAGGLDPDLILDAIGESPAATPFLRVKNEILRGASPDPDKIGASFATILKDMTLIAEEARADGLDLPIAEHMRAALETACASGWRDREMAETVLFLRQQARRTAPD